MKKLLLFFILITSLYGYSTKYYASPSGGGTGLTAGSPCTMAVARTLAHAGDTIVPTNGTYTITTQYNIPVGVSIIGSDSSNVIFNCSYASSNFALESATIVDGNQLLQGFTMNGNMAGGIAIYIVKRNNVDINAVSIKNFKDRGIHNQNPTGGLAPTVTGCDVTNSRIVNCSGFLESGSYGNLWINGVKDFSVRNCYIEASFRAGDSAGFALKMAAIANCLIDSNDIRVIGHNDNLRWAFALESNHNWGGVTYSNNNFQGVVDFAGYHTFKGEYEFGLKFLYNTVGHPEMTSYLQQGMKIEYTGTSGNFSDVEIAYNQFKNITYGIIIESTYANSILRNVSIHHNTFSPLGVLGQTYNYGVGIVNSSGSVTSSTMRDLYIDNNVFVASNIAGTRQSAAIELPIKVNAHNIRVRNNISVGFDNAWLMTRYYSTIGTLDSVFIQNNIAYSNSNSDDPKWFGITPTKLVLAGNIKLNPLFVVSGSDLSLQTLSPAIDAGLDLDYTSDIIRTPITGTPDIGAYEYFTEESTAVPVVILDPPYNTTSRGITIYGYVANDGGGTVSERGIVWSTSANPTVLNNKQASGSGLGVFKNVLSGLLPSTTYYLRGYAINEVGTAYSNEIVINTTFSSTTWDKGRIIRKNGTIKVF